MKRRGELVVLSATCRGLLLFAAVGAIGCYTTRPVTEVIPGNRVEWRFSSPRTLSVVVHAETTQVADVVAIIGYVRAIRGDTVELRLRRTMKGTEWTFTHDSARTVVVRDRTAPMQEVSGAGSAGAVVAGAAVVVVVVVVGAFFALLAAWQ